MRQFVFGIFMLLVMAIIGLVFVFIATVLVRGGFSVAHTFVSEGVPRIVAIIRADPWYGLALVIGILLVWSYPWEHENGGYSPIRRGRSINTLPARSRRRAPTRRGAAGSKQSSGRPASRRTTAGPRATRTWISRSSNFSKRR